MAENTSNGVLPLSHKTIGNWGEDFHRRRTDPIYPQHVAAGNPFPSTYSFTFRNTGTAPQYLYYVHVDKVTDFGQLLELRIAPNTDSQALLSELMKRGRVTHFEMTRPSLHGASDKEPGTR